MIDDIAKSLAKTYPVAELHGALLEQIKFARELIEQRNTIIHGSVSFEQGGRPEIQRKKLKVELNPDRLADLAERIGHVSEGLID